MPSTKETKKKGEQCSCPMEDMMTKSISDIHTHVLCTNCGLFASLDRKRVQDQLYGYSGYDEYVDLH